MADVEPQVRMFALTLGHLRSQAGMSLRQLGKHSLYDYTRLSRAEKAEVLPPPDTVERIDQALGAGGLLAKLREQAEPSSRAPHVAASVTGTDPATLEVRLEVPMPSGGTMTVRMSRRQFAQLLAGGVFTAAIPGAIHEVERVAAAVDRPSRLDGEGIAYFRRVLEEHFGADQMLGPRGLLRPVLAQVEVLDGLRRGARPDTPRALLGVLAQYAEMAGWLYQDLGHQDAAMDWTRRAADWAHCAGDKDLAAYMLIRQSNIACLGDDPSQVVQYANAARETPDADPKLVALAGQQQARGHALLGEHDECRALLDASWTLLDDHPEVRDETAPVYLHHYDLDTLHEQSATCHRLAGDGDTAADILQARLDATPESKTRERGLLKAKLALAQTRTSRSAGPDPALAAGLGTTALTAAHETGSARILRELEELDTELQTHWPDIDEVHDFHTALAA
jgi:transcriptional regulator with XRE-family HTH domain